MGIARGATVALVFIERRHRVTKHRRLRLGIRTEVGHVASIQQRGRRERGWDRHGGENSTFCRVAGREWK